MWLASSMSNESTIVASDSGTWHIPIFDNACQLGISLVPIREDQFGALSLGHGRTCEPYTGQTCPHSRQMPLVASALRS